MVIFDVCLGLKFAALQPEILTSLYDWNVLQRVEKQQRINNYQSPGFSTSVLWLLSAFAMLKCDISTSASWSMPGWHSFQQTHS